MIQIGTEIMSDWPIYAKTLKEILEELGCIEIDKGVFKISEELLKRIQDGAKISEDLEPRFQKYFDFF